MKKKLPYNVSIQAGMIYAESRAHAVLEAIPELQKFNHETAEFHVRIPSQHGACGGELEYLSYQQCVKLVNKAKPEQPYTAVNRVMQAVEQASEKFWLEVADYFSEIDGDALAPNPQNLIDNAMHAAVNEWVRGNQPEPVEIDVSVDSYPDLYDFHRLQGHDGAVFNVQRQDGEGLAFAIRDIVDDGEPFMTRLILGMQEELCGVVISIDATTKTGEAACLIEVTYRDEDSLDDENSQGINFELTLSTLY